MLSKNIASKSSSLLDLLSQHDNDYSFLEKGYFLKNNIDLLSKEVIVATNTFSKKISVIIPSFNSFDTIFGTLLTINNQVLSDSERDLLEVIVVDDGSTDNTKIRIHQQKYKFTLKYFKQDNLGRSAARNKGVDISTGETLIFLDSDVLLEKNFIREHALRCEALNKCVFISFKDNIFLSADKIFEFIRQDNKPNIEKDFRFSKFISPEWKRIHKVNNPVETRIVRIIDESNNLKDFGRGRIIGVWDLPSIALTCSISMSKKEFLKSGGFSLDFKGWGMEDTFLGACLISNRNYFIPIYSTGVFHIKHAYRSGNELNQINEFNKNVEVYNKLLEKKIDSIFYKNRDNLNL